MNDLGNAGCLPAADMVSQFRQAASRDELWAMLHRHMDSIGVTGIMYGSEARPSSEGTHDIFLTSYDPAFVEAKLSNRLFQCDEYVRAARVETSPVLWSETERLENLSREAQRSLELDWDYGVLAGVTLPMRFHHGIGRSGMGLHAAGMKWTEFDRLWASNRNGICIVANAFDVCLREQHAGEYFNLSRRERECLLWLICGLRREQIAHRLDIHLKTVEKQIESARRKLKAATVAQAVATALVYNLVSP